MRLWAPCSGGRCPCPWQGVGTGWPIRALPTQTIPWSYEMLTLDPAHLCFSPWARVTGCRWVLEWPLKRDMCCLNPSKIRALWFSGLVAILQYKEGHNIVSISSRLVIVHGTTMVPSRLVLQAHGITQAECDTCAVSSLQTGWPCWEKCYRCLWKG